MQLQVDKGKLREERMDSGKEETEVRFDQDGFYGHVQRVVLLPTI